MHNFGRTDQVDREALKRLVDCINRVPDAGDAVTRTTAEIPQIEEALRATAPAWTQQGRSR